MSDDLGRDLFDLKEDERIALIVVFLIIFLVGGFALRNYFGADADTAAAEVARVVAVEQNDNALFDTGSAATTTDTSAPENDGRGVTAAASEAEATASERLSLQNSDKPTLFAPVAAAAGVDVATDATAAADSVAEDTNVDEPPLAPTLEPVTESPVTDVEAAATPPAANTDAPTNEGEGPVTDASDATPTDATATPSADATPQTNDNEGPVTEAADATPDTTTEAQTNEGEGPSTDDTMDDDAAVPALGDFPAELSLFGAALGVAGLDEFSGADANVTLFAPTNEALMALPGGLIEELLANPDALRSLLSHHIVAQPITPSAAANGITTSTLAGTSLSVGAVNDGSLRIGGATLIPLEAGAAGRQIYVVDQLLLPVLPDGTLPPIIDASGVPTFKGNDLTVVGTAAPGTTVQLYDNNALFGVATVAADGRWLIRNDVASGSHELVAYMFDATGRLLAISAPVTLIVD